MCCIEKCHKFLHIFLQYILLLQNVLLLFQQGLSWGLELFLWPWSVIRNACHACSSLSGMDSATPLQGEGKNARYLMDTGVQEMSLVQASWYIGYNNMVGQFRKRHFSCNWHSWSSWGSVVHVWDCWLNFTWSWGLWPVQGVFWLWLELLQVNAIPILIRQEIISCTA